MGEGVKLHLLQEGASHILFGIFCREDSRDVFKVSQKFPLTLTRRPVVLDAWILQGWSWAPQGEHLIEPYPVCFQFLGIRGSSLEIEIEIETDMCVCIDTHADIYLSIYLKPLSRSKTFSMCPQVHSALLSTEGIGQ